MKPLTDGGRRLAATVPVVLLLAAAMSQLQVTMQEQMISLVCAEHRANDSPGNTTSCQSMAVLDEVPPTPPAPPRLPSSDPANPSPVFTSVPFLDSSCDPGRTTRPKGLPVVYGEQCTQAHSGVRECGR